MRKAFIILFLCINYALNATNYYVATNGNNANNGTSTSTPWATWQYGMERLYPGDILYIRAGTYTTMYGSSEGVNINPSSSRGRSGTSGGIITVSGYPGDAMPVLDCSSLTSGSEHNGIIIENCSYWTFTRLVVINSKERGSGQPAPGWTLSKCNYITLNWCVLHDNDNGFISYNGNEVRYINCDSYANGVGSPYWGNNGFYARASGTSTTYFTGCRAWLNGQDGNDCFADVGTGGGYIYWDKCWSFSNSVTYSGAGFKLGTNRAPSVGSNPQRVLTNCIAAKNPLGFDESQDAGLGYSVPIAIYNCVSYNNTAGFNFQWGTGLGGSLYADNIINNISYLDGSVGYWGSGTTNKIDHNSWNGYTVTSADFLSVDVEQLKGARKADGSLPDISAFHLVTGSALIDKGIEVNLPYTGKSPDLGAFEVQGAAVVPTVPAYVSSVVESATPSLLAMSFDSDLNNLIVPALSSFSVSVNSANRTVSSFTISGKKVQLTLSSAIKSGDVILVSYIKPATNPLQTAAGGVAADISAKSVTNNCVSNLPVYSSSVVENATPSLLEITYSISLANIVPAKTAFSVQVNTVLMAINSIAISGSKIQITLSGVIKYGDLITVSYTKPSVNPLQAADGGQAISITNQLTANKLTKPILTPGLKMTVFPNPVHQIIHISFEYGSDFSSLDPSSTSQIIRIFDFSGKLFLEKLVEPGIKTVQIPVNLKPGIYIVFVLAGNTEMNSQKIIVY
jgi:uncharacterized repeat protein (TIGR02059 family)